MTHEFPNAHLPHRFETKLSASQFEQFRPLRNKYRIPDPSIMAG